MPKFRKKPVVIEAEPYSLGMEDCWLCGGIPYSKDQMEKSQGLGGEFKPAIKTLAGPLPISPGDWIITEDGKRYPIGSDVLERDYEPVEEDKPEVEVTQQDIEPPPKTYACKYCGETFDSPPKLAGHTRNCKAKKEPISSNPI